MSLIRSFHPTIASIHRRVRRLRARWKVEVNLDPAIRRYIRFCRETFPSDYPKDRDSVVLVGLFHWNASVHCYAHVCNYLARKTRSAIEWFSLGGRRNFTYEKIYAGFGARQGLVSDELGIDEEAARELADQIFAGLRTKWDVVNIRFEDVTVGDLIYDSYLRVRTRTTVDFRDTALRDVIHHAVRLAMGVRRYFARKYVTAAIVDHTTHIYSGILVRMACAEGIPVYQVYYGPDFHVVRVEMDREVSDVPTRFPWARYRELFRQLTPEQQAQARERGRRGLSERLSGKVDGVLFSRSAYEVSEAPPVFAQSSGKPRILILLHDFCDYVHGYRKMLFPDFYEWARFLFEKAGETSYEWYAKPHPSILLTDDMGRPEQTLANRKVLAELAEKFPHVRFLDPAISNRQLIDEGISAMFTVHGTAGHEFAYLGVPVVNAGDNPHIGYNFNLHPQTVEEYADYISRAGHLDLKIDREELEEYFFMNYFYYTEFCGAEGNPIPASYWKSEDYLQAYNGNKPAAFDDFAQPLGAEETARLNQYFDRTLVVREARPA